MVAALRIAGRVLDQASADIPDLNDSAWYRRSCAIRYDAEFWVER